MVGVVGLFVSKQNFHVIEKENPASDRKSQNKTQVYNSGSYVLEDVDKRPDTETPDEAREESVVCRANLSLEVPEACANKKTINNLKQNLVWAWSEMPPRGRGEGRMPYLQVEKHNVTTANDRKAMKEIAKLLE